MIIEELVAELGYRFKDTGDLRRFQSGLNGLEKKSEESAARLRRLGVAAGVAISGGVTLTGAAVRNFAGFERTMNRIGNTTDATAGQVKQASDDVQRMAKDFAMPVEEAIAGLDTLVASGMSLEQAMAFLPSVLATAQASGSATQDIANTAQKAASALKLEANELQRAFDIMVTGGKAGQFELKDMAGEIPELANAFASLGYEGQEGLQKLIAVLQTLREDTGSSATAATQARNIFSKMYSEETAGKFKKFGIDLRAEMEAAKQSGEDALSAFLRLSKEAIDGDLSKIPQLFTDMEFQSGMRSLITSQESFDKFMAAVNSAEVDGTVFRDLDRILGDTESKIQRLSSSWDQFLKALGSAAAGPVGGALDYVTDALDRQQAVQRGLEKRGASWFERNVATLRSPEEVDRIAREGGYVPVNDPVAQETARNAPFAYEVLGRRPNRPISVPASVVEDDRRVYEDRFGADPVGMNVLGGLEARLEAMNANLASMTGEAAIDPVITDARVDSRNLSRNVEVNVGGVHVQQAAQAPAAVGAAVGQAAGNAAVDSVQIQSEPAF